MFYTLKFFSTVTLPGFYSLNGRSPARALLAAPDGSPEKACGDRAMLATLLYHGLRHAELYVLHPGRPAGKLRRAAPAHARHG